MHILLIADGRSPHTVGWLRGMTRLGIVTTLVSSRLLDPTHVAVLEDLLGPGRIHQPSDLWNRVRPHLTVTSAIRKNLRSCASRWAKAPTVPARPINDSLLACCAESYAAWRLESTIKSVVKASRPDALHALRIQYEAMASARADTGLPLAVSTWGSDLIATAKANELLGRGTREALRRTKVLMSDCERDARLAREWELPASAPTHVVPGNFGVDLDRFPERDPSITERLGLTANPLVVFPRGASGFVNYRGFVDAARALLSEGVPASFLGVGLESAIGPGKQVPGSLRCVGRLDHGSMLEIAASSAVTVSPSWSDGMPNSVIEGMAGGSIPVCSDLASLRELEGHGAVMSWCDPSSSESIASAIRLALDLSAEPGNRALNRRVVAEHYSTSSALHRMAAAYRDLAAAHMTDTASGGPSSH